MSDEDFFAHKIRTLFSRFDVDSNGKIEKEDFAGWSQKLISIGNLNSEQQENLEININNLWANYFLPADSDNDGSVEESELIDFMRDVSNDEKKLEGIHGSLQLIFDAIDSNQDEAISSEEFGIYFQSLGVSDNAFADVIFNEMDSNKDGLLNKHEFKQFGLEFFCGNDFESPSKFFFGPLV